MTAADAAVCRCGHPKERHDRKGCRVHRFTHNWMDCPCAAFVADVNRPDDAPKWSDLWGMDPNYAAVSGRGAGELADLLAAHGREITSDQICQCGYNVDGAKHLAAAYRAHVAAVIVTAGWEKR